MRTLTIAALLLGLTALAGCDHGKTTDPKELPPLSAEDLAQIKQRDAEIQEEEGGPSFGKTAPKSGPVRGR